MKNPKSKSIKINLKYRDVICRGCKKTFRAGYACDGYMEIIPIGYHSIIDRDNLIICPECTQVVYRLLGEPDDNCKLKAPTTWYSWNPKTNNTNEKPDSMTLYGVLKPSEKYNKKRLKEAVDKYSNKMKKKEPWNHIDYHQFAGLKK